MPVREDQCAHAGDASLYVLGELYGRQRDSFLRHMRRCEECAEEVELLKQASSMPMLGAAHLPPVEEDPGRKAPTPTLTVAAANARAARLAAEKAAAEGRRRAPMEPPARPVLRTIPGGAGAGSPRKPSRGARRLLKTPMPRSVMISFVALAILAVATVVMTSRAASARYYRIQAGWHGGGAALQLVGDQLELLVKDMPKPAPGTGYQVWVVRRGTRGPVATSAWIRLNRLHEAGVKVPGDYHDWAAIAVYVEPLTGRRTAHSGAVVVGDLRSLS